MQVRDELKEEVTSILKGCIAGLTLNDLYKKTTVVEEKMELAQALHQIKKDKSILFIGDRWILSEFKTMYKKNNKIDLTKMTFGNLNTNTKLGKLAMYLFEHKEKAFQVNDLYSNIGLEYKKSNKDINPLIELGMIRCEKFNNRNVVIWSNKYDYPFPLDVYIERTLIN